MHLTVLKWQIVLGICVSFAGATVLLQKSAKPNPAQLTYDDVESLLKDKQDYRLHYLRQQNQKNGFVLVRSDDSRSREELINQIAFRHVGSIVVIPRDPCESTD